MNNFKLSLEKLKRDGRFSLGLSTEQAASLYDSMKPIAEVLEKHESNIKTIRKNSMLSDSGKTIEADKARQTTLDEIVNHALRVLTVLESLQTYSNE